jgi:hypothetical protein
MKTSSPSSGKIVRGYPHLDQVRRSITRLHRDLPAPMLAQVHASLPIADSSLSPQADLTIEVQRLAGRIARHLGLPNGHIFVSFSPSLSHPAQVELSRSDDYLISLQDTYRYNPQDIGAILAHEITHIFLYCLGITDSNSLNNELLTDTAAAYLGVGWLCLNAFRISIDDHYHPGYLGSQVQRTISASTVGYLTPEEFGYVLAKRSLFYGERIDQILTLQARELYHKGLHLARHEQRQPPLRRAWPWHRWLYYWRRWRASQSTPRSPDAAYGFDQTNSMLKVTFRCPVCCQRLRLPTHRRRIQLDCPTCHSTLQCKT